MKTTRLRTIPKVKRTMTLTEETDCRIRTLAASQRIAVGDLVEKIIKQYFAFTLAQKDE